MLRPYISQGMRQQKGAHETISKHSTQIMNSNCNLKVIKSNIIQLFSQKLILIYNLLLFYNICDFLLTFSHFSYPTLSLFKFSLFTLAFCEFLSLPIFCVVLTFIKVAFLCDAVNSAAVYLLAFCVARLPWFEPILIAFCFKFDCYKLDLIKNHWFKWFGFILIKIVGL